MDASGAVNRLHQIILGWDYFKLWDRQEAGLGVYDTLRAVPDTFKDIDVSGSLGAAAGGGGW
jgi:hypothetical protein